MYLVLFKTEDPRCPDGGYVTKCLTARLALKYVEELEKDEGIFDIEVYDAKRLDD